MFPPLNVFLGGNDLEMKEIGALARARLGPERVHDANLTWGARASAYADEIRNVIARGEKAVLVELADDLPSDVPRESVIIVDHHGARAGADKPSSLRQVFSLLECDSAKWTRRFTLVEANDIGHIAALREAGASAAEIRAIRNEDRAAQCVSAQDEDDARLALRAARRVGRLFIVELGCERSSPVGDFVEPEYGGPGAEELLVLTPASVNFYGSGRIVRALRDEPHSWHGGALPVRGFWGLATRDTARRAGIVARIGALLG